ncbi:aldo/keto reductase family protein [Phenylobacterium sp.]|uniref:aldo/keto reductase family protein n=1 Tax=Phenylobacterium sp. TaxID=1871053 RepID=UPI002FC69DB5
MRYRQLGSSDLMVSEISLGTWLSFGEGEARARHIACLHRALELGVNLIDTANVYGFGESERLVGEALAGRPRDSYLLATKLWGPMADGDRGLSRAQVFKQIDGSLQRLRTDHVDLYQCHRYDDETPLEETMEALSEVVRQGKVRYLGFSEWPADRIAEAQAMVGTERFVSSQPQYSLLWRQPEAEVFPLCRAQGIGQLIWSPLAQGVLTGKYAPDAGPPGGLRGASVEMSKYTRHWFKPAVLQAVQRLKPLAAEAGLTLGQFAIAWTLANDQVSSAIIGASRPDQVDENVAASERSVDPALFAEAEQILGAALAAAAAKATA